MPSPMEEVAEAGGDKGSAAALPQTDAGRLLYGGAGSTLALQQTAVGSAATAAGGGITLRLCAWAAAGGRTRRRGASLDSVPARSEAVRQSLVERGLGLVGGLYIAFTNI